MSTIHFYVGSETGEYIFFDNEIDMYEYAMKHNLDIDSTDCLVYDHAEMGLEELTREDIEHGGIDYSQEGETLQDYIFRRSDAECDYLDMIVKLRKDFKERGNRMDEYLSKIIELRKDRDKYFKYLKEKDYECECIRERMVEAETLNEKLKKENKELEGECDRLSQLETIIWTQLFGEEKVLDDTKPHILEDAINKLKKENKEMNKIINECEEWVDLCKNDRGLIESYDMRAIDIRLRGGREETDSESDNDL